MLLNRIIEKKCFFLNELTQSSSKYFKSITDSTIKKFGVRNEEIFALQNGMKEK